MSRVRVMGNVTPIQEQVEQQVALSKTTIATSTMLGGLFVAAGGAWAAWGPAYGAMVVGIGLFVVGILLGIG